MKALFIDRQRKAVGKNNIDDKTLIFPKLNEKTRLLYKLTN